LLLSFLSVTNVGSLKFQTTDQEHQKLSDLGQPEACRLVTGDRCSCEKKGLKMIEDSVTTSEASTSDASNISKFRFDRILAPTDFSHNSERAVDYAIQLAKRLGAKLTLLHVIPEPSALDYEIGGFPDEEIQERQKEAQKRLAERLTRAKIEYQEVDSLQRTGLHPRDEIVSVARDLPADLLVISTHGYTGWKHFLLGGHAEKILEQAPCPTLVIR
jgi:universal stress protein A